MVRKSNCLSLSSYEREPINLLHFFDWAGKLSQQWIPNIGCIFKMKSYQSSTELNKYFRGQFIKWVFDRCRDCAGFPYFSRDMFFETNTTVFRYFWSVCQNYRLQFYLIQSMSIFLWFDEIDINTFCSIKLRITLFWRLSLIQISLLYFSFFCWKDLTKDSEIIAE